MHFPLKSGPNQTTVISKMQGGSRAAATPLSNLSPALPTRGGDSRCVRCLLFALSGNAGIDCRGSLVAKWTLAVHRAAAFEPSPTRTVRLSCNRPVAAILDLAERDDVSTYRKGQKHNRETPKQSSMLSLPNSATQEMSLLRAGQTFQ